jgi:NAD(P)-dependent dehydrogenase (short-subunit alcohol dehydrogenase family)
MPRGRVDLYPSPTTGKAEPFHNHIATGTPAHEALRETYGGKYIFVCADPTKAEDVERAVATCAKEFGRLDVVVNNAGISVGGTHVRPLRIHETAEDGYDKIMAVMQRRRS